MKNTQNNTFYHDLLKLSVICLCLFSFAVEAKYQSPTLEPSKGIQFHNEFSMRAGMTSGYMDTRGLQGTSDKRATIGFTTSVSYRFKRIQWTISSYTLFGGISNLSYDTKVIQFSKTSGRFRNVAITPTARYHPNIQLGSFSPYLGAGILWSHRTNKLRRAQMTTKTDLSNNKINYESRGLIIQLGIHQTNQATNGKFPLFIELSLIHSQSRNVSLIDTSNFRKTEILSKQDAPSEIKNSKVLLSLGARLF